MSRGYGTLLSKHEGPLSVNITVGPDSALRMKIKMCYFLIDIFLIQHMH